MGSVMFILCAGTEAGAEGTGEAEVGIGSQGYHWHCF